MNRQNDILDFLIQKKIISAEQANQLQILLKDPKNGGKKIDDVLAEEKMIDAEKLAAAKAEMFNLPYENLFEKKIDEKVLGIIPAEVAENYKIVCFDKSDKNIKIGLIDPGNFKAIEAVEFLAKEVDLRVEYFLISEKSFKIALKQYKTFGEEITSALRTKEEEEAEGIKKISEEESVESTELTKSAPITKIVSVIIRHAVEGGASDIHIEPMQNETRVRYRIDGILQTSLVLPKNIHNSIVARIKVISNLKLDETRIPQDGRIRLKVDEKEIDFRVSTLPLMGVEKVVMRILEVAKKAPSLRDLGFEGVGLEVIEKNLKNREGLALVTGPTGSGKSTTLYAVVNIINKEGINICTVEDPVEYQIKGANQSQVRPEIGYTFAAGLRSLLRQDPDVIMVGEIRDNETAELAIHAALTGHLVLSTLHTIDAPGAIARLVDMEIEPFLLSSTLHTVMAQRLCRKICPNCRVELKISDEYIGSIKKIINEVSVEYVRKLMPDFSIDKMVFYKGKGCSNCNNMGYKGRIAIAEVLDVNDNIKSMIAEGKKMLKIKDILENQKFITFKQDGIIKVLQGLTTFEEVLRVIAI